MELVVIDSGGPRRRPAAPASPQASLHRLPKSLTVCTSQIYLPTLMYMAQAGDPRLRAIGLLLLYNLMFVPPLIVLFVAAYFGVNARTMAKRAAQHTATVKLAMSLLFVGFTLYLFTVSARMLPSG